MIQLQKRRLVRSFVILAVAVGLYAVAGFVVAPRYLRSALIEQIDRQLGVRASVGEVRVNPFLFQVDIRDFMLPDPAGARILGFRRLFVDFELSSIWHRAFVFQDIEINAPYAHPVVSPAGSLNLLALKPRVAPPPAPARTGPEPPLPHVEIGLFRVTDGELTYQDLSRATPFSARIEPIHFELRDFTTGVEGGRFTFAGSSAQGERLEWRGHIVLQPLASDGEFTVSHLQVRTVWEYLKDQLGFVVSSGSIDLNGHYDFAMKERPELRAGLANLTLSNLGLRPDAGSPDWITVPQLRISGTDLDLQRRQVTIDGITLAGPRVSLWYGPDGRLNLQQLAGTRVPATASSGGAPPAPQAAAPQAAVTAAAAPPPPWQLSLKELKLSDGTIAAEDRSARPYAPLTLAPLNLTVSGASLDLGKPVGLAFDTGLNGSGHLAIGGTLTPAPLAADLKIDASALGLRSLQPYLARATSVTLLDGALSTALQLRVRSGKAAHPTLLVTGTVGVDHLHTVDNALRRELVSWERLGISGIRYQQHPDRLELASITAIKPYARVIIAPDCSLNVAEALRAPGAAPRAGCASKTDAGRPAGDKPAAGGPGAGKSTILTAAKATAAKAPVPAAPGMQIAIGRITVHSGQAQFADLSITPNFATGIVALEGGVSGLSSDPQSRAHIDLKGQVDQYSPVAISGVANVLSARRYLDLSMSFRNMELTTFNPYSGKFAGYNITKGKLTTELQYKIDDRKLDARHHITIDQLEFGDRTASKDAVSLPIKLAVALLKDRNGVIDLDVPVTGSLDDPHFRLGPIIWKVLVNLLVKIVASPFALLGNLFGGGPDMQFVDFAPGSASLVPSAQQRIAAVAKALAERPQLKIELPIAVAAAADRPALVEKAFNDELVAEAQRHAAKGAAITGIDALTVPARVSLETALYRKETGQAPQFPKPEPPAPGAAVPDPNAGRLEYLEKALHERIMIGDDALKALAQSRAQTLQQALLAGGQIDPSRVFLVVNDKVAVKDGAVRLELTLQ